MCGRSWRALRPVDGSAQAARPSHSCAPALRLKERNSAWLGAKKWAKCAQWWHSQDSSSCRNGPQLSHIVAYSASSARILAPRAAGRPSTHRSKPSQLEIGRFCTKYDAFVRRSIHLAGAWFVRQPSTTPAPLTTGQQSKIWVISARKRYSSFSQGAQLAQYIMQFNN